jgi:glycosyltransferase involved in cell wall biosynthesis
MLETTGSHALLEQIETPQSLPASIVIVCYNQAQFLGQSIQSALAQTHEPLEILVVDDGSTDQTPAVCADFPRVLYIRQHNQGLAAARNTGLRHTTGDYVTFLDADDQLLPDAVDVGLRRLAAFPDAAFAYGAYRNIFSDGSPAPTETPAKVQADHYFHLLQGNFIGMHGAVLYRRNALLEVGGFNESLPAAEDYEIYLRMARSHAIASHDNVVAEYRQHDDNMSKDFAFMLRSILAVLRMESKHVPDRRHAQALRAGVGVWRTYYGELLLEQWKQTRGKRRLWEIFRLWPQGVLRQGAKFGLKSLLQRVRGHGPYRVRFGNLRRLAPLNRDFGFTRGQPIDRYYIERFLQFNAEAIRGRVLEIGDDSYSRRFGAGCVTYQDVLHVVPGFPGATITADLAHAPHIPSETFDCIILTQTLHYIFDVQAAIATVWRILKPGGVALVTLPGISQVCRDQQDRDSDCWRFTAASATRLFGRCFTELQVRVQTYGNVLTAMSFLSGLAVSDLKTGELDFHDPDYPLTIAVVARKGHTDVSFSS